MNEQRRRNEIDNKNDFIIINNNRSFIIRSQSIYTRYRNIINLKSTTQAHHSMYTLVYRVGGIYFSQKLKTYLIILKFVVE